MNLFQNSWKTTLEEIEEELDDLHEIQPRIEEIKNGTIFEIERTNIKFEDSQEIQRMIQILDLDLCMEEHKEQTIKKKVIIGSKKAK